MGLNSGDRNHCSNYYLQTVLLCALPLSAGKLDAAVQYGKRAEAEVAAAQQQLQQLEARLLTALRESADAKAASAAVQVAADGARAQVQVQDDS
jgi:hypothetical protein